MSGTPQRNQEAIGVSQEPDRISLLENRFEILTAQVASIAAALPLFTAELQRLRGAPTTPATPTIATPGTSEQFGFDNDDSNLPRRRSSMFHPGAARAAVRTPAVSLPVNTNAGVNVVHLPTPVPTKHQMRKYTIAAIMRTLRYMVVRNANEVTQVTIQNCISAQIALEIWDKECSQDTDYSVFGSLEDMMRMPHADYMKMMARHLRPESHKEYCEKLFSCLKPVVLPEGFTFASPDYDLHMARQLANVIRTFRDFDEFCRAGATTAQLKNMPRPDLGRDEDQAGIGAFSIVLTHFGPLAEPLKRLIGVDRLKHCRTMDEFVTLMLQFNNDLAEKAKESRTSRLGLERKMTFQQLAAVATQRAQDPYNSDDDDKANNIQFTELAYRRILQRSPLLQG